MSAPYLNRGETIILTTHRVSVGNTEYDALLTTERLILMDRCYTRFEPRMILFPDIVTVKAGKAPAGDPAIILTLEGASDLTGSERADIIFLQEPGEERKEEREQWVRELIGLVIAARERGAREQDTGTVQKKSGMQPSVRRWVAPESPHPRTSLETPAPPAPEPAVIAEGPDPMEFFLETKTKSKRAVKKKKAVPPRKNEAAPAIAPEPVPVIPPESKTAPPTAGDIQRTVPPAGETPPNSPDVPSTDPAPADTFARLVASAAASLQVRDEPVPVPPPGDPVIQMDSGKIPSEEPRVPEPVVPPAMPAPEPECPTIAPVPEPAGAPEPVASSVPPAPGTRRELPGTYAPDLPVIVPAETPKTPAGDRRKTGRWILVGGALILVLLAILGSVVLLSSIPFWQQDNPPSIVTVTPSVTGGSAPAQSSAAAPAGVEVRIGYPGKYFGTLGNPGYLQKVSGTGTSTYPVRMLTDIVQATIQKQDNSGEALTVGIYNNRTLLTEKTITAPMGEVNLLINVSTELPPGLEVTATPQRSGNLLGNGSLVYY